MLRFYCVAALLLLIGALVPLGSEAGAPTPPKILPMKPWPIDVDPAIHGLIDSLVFSPDGDSLALACKDKSVLILDVQTGGRLQHLRGHPNYILAMTWSEKDNLLFAASARPGIMTIKVWEPKTGKQHASHSLEDAGTARAISPDGKYVVSVKSYPNTTAHVSEIASGKEIAALDGGEPMVHANCAAFSRNGKVLAIGGGDGKAGARVDFWDVATFEKSKFVQSESRHRGARSLSLTAKGDLMLLNATDSQLWDLTLPKRIPCYRFLHAISCDGSCVALGSGLGIIGIRSLPGLKKVVDLQIRRTPAQAGSVILASFSPDGRFFATADGTQVHVWDLQLLKKQDPAPPAKD